MWLIVVDAKTKWPEVAMMKNTTTESTMAAIINLFWTHGLPVQIVSDNGPQFTAAEFGKFCAERGIIHTRTALYHPQSNGEAERTRSSRSDVRPRMRTKLDLVRPVLDPKKGGGVVVKSSQKYQDTGQKGILIAERGNVPLKSVKEFSRGTTATVLSEWKAKSCAKLKADETASDHESSEDSESNASNPEGKEAGREQELSPNRDLARTRRNIHRRRHHPNSEGRNGSKRPSSSQADEPN
uniref:Integrase catalytic domain-containing protein n=1 Tax=Globodera rostochiensis TaxID=31243 RepID=A0A914GSM6_GLORO